MVSADDEPKAKKQTTTVCWGQLPPNMFDTSKQQDDVGVAYFRLQKKLQDVWLKGHDVCITCRLMLVVAVRQHTVTTVRYQRY